MTRNDLVLFRSKRVRRRNLEIKRIEVPNEQDLKDLIALFANPKRPTVFKRYMARQITGGTCIICQQVPFYTVEHHADHCTIIEKYCESCCRKENFI